MAHAAGFFDSVSGVITPPRLGPFQFEPKAALFWTTGFAGFHGTGSMSYSFGFATADYANCSVIGSDTIVGHLDCGSVWSDPTQFAPMFAGNSGTPAAYNRQTTDYAGCAVDLGADNYGVQWRTYYLVLGGDTLQVAAGELTGGLISGLAFEPQLIVCHGAINAGADDAYLEFGYCDHDLNQGGLLHQIVYFCQEFSIALSGFAGPVQITGMLADGFAYVPAFPFDNASYLALADPGGGFFVGSTPWAAGSVSGFGFEPQIALGLSAVYNEDNSAGVETAALITAGYAAQPSMVYPAAAAASNAATKNITGINDNPFSGWGSSTLWNDSDEADLILSTINDGTRTGQLAVDSFDADGLTFSGATPGGTAYDLQFAGIRLSDYTGTPCRPGALPVLGVG